MDLHRNTYLVLVFCLCCLIVGEISARDSHRRILSEDGKLLERYDDFGNRTVYGRDAAGRIESITHERNHVGTWTDRWIANAEDQSLAEIIDANSAFGQRVSQIIREIGIERDVAIPEPEYHWTGKRHIVRSHYATVTEWATRPWSDDPGTILSRQRTEVNGQSITVETVSAGEGVMVRDDRGGWRYEIWGEDGLALAKDRHGTVLRVRQRDRLGRPTEIEIGEVGLLRFEFEDGTPQWTAKELVDRRTGRAVFRWESTLRADQIVTPDQELRTRPRPSARVRLPHYGDVVEWDATLHRNGVILAGVGGIPFALLPFEGDGEILYSLTLDEANHVAWGWDRIDYDADQMHLHFLTDAADADSRPQTSILTMPRRWSTPVPRAEDAMPNLRSRDRLEIISIPDGGTEELRPRPRPCPPPNVGCLCWEWNSGVGIDCPNPPSEDDGGGGSPGGGEDGGGDGPDGGGAGPASGSQALSPEQQQRMNAAKSRAKNRLNNLASCRNLFSNLNLKDGAWVIDNSTYRFYGNSSACNDGAALWTNVGSRNVYMCQSFMNQSSDMQAALVIHEAMHSAGQRESPQYGPGYPTSNQLTLQVRSECNL